MKKSLFLWSVLFVLFYNHSAIAYDSPLSFYLENYFILGKAASDTEEGANEEQIKGQISLKYRLLEGNNSELYFGYTDTFWWMTQEKSKKVREHNYNTDFFYRFNMTDYYQGHCQLGLAHKSNGEDGEESRSTNFAYAQMDYNYGERYNFGMKITGWYYVRNSIKNADLKNYTGNAEYEYYFKFFDQKNDNKNLVLLSYKFLLGDNKNLSNGRQDISFMLRLVSKKINPYLYFKYETGYGVNGLIDYNEKDTTFKLGLILK